MFDYELFIGFPIDSDYEFHLSKVPAAQLEFFIQNDSNYLQKRVIDGLPYLGKSLGLSLSIHSIELQKNHIFSLLKRLVPDYSYDLNSLTIMASHVS